MNRIRARLADLLALLRDRQRSQRGSVLSAVLIMVAFLAIISGAITTELSTSFLLSQNLLNRVNTESTVNSAAELGIDQLQGIQLNNVCPGPVTTPFPLNNLTATATFVSCEAVIHRGESTAFTPVASSSPFKVDGTYAQGLNDYVVGDAGGNVFDYRFGSTAWRWKVGLGGSVTAPPAVIADPTAQGEYLDLIPLSGSPCAPASFCVAVLSDDGSLNKPQLRCTMPSAASIESQPAGRSNSAYAYAGDSAGNLYAMDLTANEPCSLEDKTVVGDPIVAGPVAFRCKTSCGGPNPDEVLVLTSNSTSSHVLTYLYSGNGFKAPSGSLFLSWPAPSGIALDGSTLPARLAITFSGGRVALVNVDTGATPTAGPSVGLSTGISGAPFWCHCPGNVDLIGVGDSIGALYVLSASLATFGAYTPPPNSPGIGTAPAADAMGDWYFGADDGQLHEVVKQGTSMVQVASYGPASGPIGSSPVVGTCPAGICAYLGSSTSKLYELSLDARSAVITACITVAPPACSGANPQLWTHVEIGMLNSAQAVHVEGWSYYSP